MHVYWTGLATDLWRNGNTSMQWVLDEAGKGKVFAAGNGESGNDSPGIYSTCEAKKVAGGYKFHGHKMFGSLTPVWDCLGFHGQDNSDPDNSIVIHAFMPREWGIKIIVAKYRSVESLWCVMDKAMDVMGGFGLLRKAGFERLFRDARLGKIHPANGYLLREFFAKAMLGIDMNYQPR